MIWTAAIAFQMKKIIALPSKLLTNLSSSSVMGEEETPLSPMCEEAVLVLLCVVERQLYPQEGSARSSVSISVICSPSTAPGELPLSLLYCHCGWRVADTVPALTAVYGDTVFHSVSSLNQIKAFPSCSATPKICTHRNAQHWVRVQPWRQLAQY